MRRPDHFLILYRSTPAAPALAVDEGRDRLSAAWEGAFHVREVGPFLLAWSGPPSHPEAPLLRVLGSPYNVGTARPADIAAGTVEAAGELDGAFVAFAFDPGAPQCTLVTDRFGLFPLYEHDRDGTWCFSTSLPGLLALRPAGKVDPEGVREMLTLHMVLGNRTLLQEVRLVPPATALHLRSGPPRAAPYWSWEGLGSTKDEGLDLVHETYALVEQAVLRGVPAHAKKVALPLDGGLDSRLIGAVLARNGVPVRAYHLEDGKESALVREVARAIGAPVKSVPPNEPHAIPAAHRAIDCCYHVGQVKGRELARRAAEEDGCEVLFDGLGLDAILGPPPHPAGLPAGELARDFERRYAGISEEDLAAVMGERTAREEVFPAVRASLEEQAGEAIKSAGVRAGEAFLLTNRIRKYSFGARLAQQAYLAGRFPGLSTRLFEHCLRLPADLRQGHTLYRRVYLELFPELARIPWARTGLPLDRLTPEPPSRWRLWLSAAVRPFRRGPSRGEDRFDREFRKRGPLQETFLAVLKADVEGLEGVLPEGFAARVVERRLAGENLGGLLGGLYTIKHFLASVRRPVPASGANPTRR
jgi:asparagine synthetase B (glutamine-hydrolysing)